mmetsp:Transcript_155854/g.270323  ORF Transcript_155854/g.270323 Transcript_155854/m.270323 type:complete len:460 (+) Transcript_155854:106-1485(+)
MARRLVNKKLMTPPVCSDMSLKVNIQPPIEEENEEEMEDLETQVNSVRSFSSSESQFWDEEASERMRLTDDEGRVRGQGLLKMLQQGNQVGFPFEDEDASHPMPRSRMTIPSKILQRSDNFLNQYEVGAPYMEEHGNMPAQHPSYMMPNFPQRDPWNFGGVGNPLREERSPQSEQYPNTNLPPKSSHRGSNKFEEQEPPPPFAQGPPRPKAKLRSSASMFIPQNASGNTPPPYAMPQGISQNSGQLPVRCIIEGAFGNRLCNLAMVDQDALTEVNVIVSENAYPTGYSWELDPLAQSRAMHVLLEAFKILGSKVKSIEPTSDNTQLSLKYSEVPSDTLCWEHAKTGFCPRAACRWVHAAFEMFIINVILHPVVPQTQARPVLVVPITMPVVPVSCCETMPEDTNGDADAATTASSKEDEQASTEDDETTASGSSKTDSSTRPDRICWADIEDDDEPQYQ